MKEGAATFTYTDGSTHTGEWEMDRMVNPPPVRKSSSEKSLEAVRSKYAAEIRLSDSVKELVAGLGGNVDEEILSIKNVFVNHMGTLRKIFEVGQLFSGIRSLTTYFSTTLACVSPTQW